MNNKEKQDELDDSVDSNYLKINVEKKGKFAFKLWMLIPIVIIIVSIVIYIRPARVFTRVGIQDILYNSESGSYKNNVIEVVEKINPTVVSISENETDLYDGEYTNANVTGIIFDSKGYILTAYDAIKEYKDLYIKFSSRNRRPIKAALVGFNLANNLAILKVEVDNLPVAHFGDYSKLRIGDMLVAIGAPTGDDITCNASVGVTSFKNKTATLGRLKLDLLQTDAKISKYNLGGPICNSSGDIVGINVGVVFENKDIMSGGFVISVNDIKKSIRDILDNPKVYPVEH